MYSYRVSYAFISIKSRIGQSHSVACSGEEVSEDRPPQTTAPFVSYPKADVSFVEPGHDRHGRVGERGWVNLPPQPPALAPIRAELDPAVAPRGHAERVREEQDPTR